MVASLPPTTPPYLKNTAVLKRRGGFDEEYNCDVALYPCMLVQMNPNGDGGVMPHATPGGRAERMIAKEDALQGLWFADQYTVGSIVSVYQATPEEEVLFCCNAGCPAIAMGQFLTSNGDGTIVPVPQDGNLLYQNVAQSTTLTNSTVETVFSNGTYTLPANFLQVGDVINIKAEFKDIAVNSTDTITYRLRIGGVAGTVIFAFPAVNPVVNDIGYIDIQLVITAIGVSGSFVASGHYGAGAQGTATEKPLIVAASTVNTTVSEAIVASGQWSVANAGDQCALTNMTVTVNRSGQTWYPVGVATQAVNNSAGSFLAYVPTRLI